MGIGSDLITPKIVDINLRFYFFLKSLNGSDGKLTGNNLNEFIVLSVSNPDKDFETVKELLLFRCEKIKSEKIRSNISLVITSIVSEVEFKTFTFALKLLKIKPLLLAEADLIKAAEITEQPDLNLLSIKYDTLSKSRPYLKRVSGALISQLFFSKIESGNLNYISSETSGYMENLNRDYVFLKEKGLEPNSIYMLMLSESINQSIISDAGVSYEDRIKQTLITLGLKRESITKVHDKADSSTEFDFFFELAGRTYGIGAKRTLRERYKQFIKTAYMSKIDVMIEITLGIDLSREKAEAIVKHGIILFVADEAYEMKPYFKEVGNIYPVSGLTLDKIKSL